MPRFYFHLFNDLDVRDEEGLELPDKAAAIEQAVKNARVMAAESVCEGHLVLNHRIEIMDANGSAVATVRFGDAVEVQQ